MTLSRFSKILILSLCLAAIGRSGLIAFEEFRQNTLTKEICDLVSLPLETGLLRDTHEGLENALKNRGEVNSCVSVTDNGRSYSPNCTLSGSSYRTVMCKAEGNAGVRAAVSFESQSIITRKLFYLWLEISVFIIAMIAATNLLARYVIAVYSEEVKGLVFGEKSQIQKKSSVLRKLARLTMEKVGISKSLTEQATGFRAQLLEYEKKIKREVSERSRLEQQAIDSHAYVEKVKQIRHDVRSPLSSLQAIYEKLKVDDLTTTKALANAIRRIQILVDDLNQVDRVKEEPRLVIAEVIAEEIALTMSAKFRDSKSAKLNIEYRSEALSPIKVGEKEFQAALENILENALDAIPVGGQVKVSIQSNARACKIVVEDNGYGISPDDLPKLFTKGGSFKKINGIGLGLYHTKQNIESWGGTVACSPLEVGTSFTITIPLMQTGVVFSGLPPRDQQLKIVDDDQATSKALKGAGYKVIEVAANYEAGKELLDSGTSDLFSILVDQRLDNEKLGSDLIAQQIGRNNVFLCTNDFDSLDLIRKARQVGVKIIPKPLCYFGAYRLELATDAHA